MVRLNAAGWSRRKIAQHTGRTYGTVCQDLKRWHEHGVDGLIGAPATNQPEKLTLQMRKLVLNKLREHRTELGPTGRALPVLVDQSGTRLGERQTTRLSRNALRTLVAFAWIAAAFLFTLDQQLEPSEVVLLATLGGVFRLKLVVQLVQKPLQLNVGDKFLRSHPVVDLLPRYAVASHAEAKRILKARTA